MFRSFIILAVFGFILSGCNSTPSSTSSTTTTTGTDQFLVIPGKQFGPITRDLNNREGILKAFGESNVEKAPVYVGEGMEMPGLIVFKGTKNEVEIIFDPAESMDIPVAYRVSKEGGDWRTDTGIKVGSSIADLEGANGKTFMFYGFDWDFGGNVTNWNDGKLNFDLQVRMGYDGALNAEGFSGEVEISSSNPKATEQGIKVDRFSIVIN